MSDESLTDTVFPVNPSDCPYCSCQAVKYCDGCDTDLCDGCFECHNGDHHLEDDGCHMDTCERQVTL